VLLTNKLKPWIKKQWCIPTQADAEFVSHMDDVLSVYTRPHNPVRPQVCMDEINTQLLADMRDPLPMEPGKLAPYGFHLTAFDGGYCLKATEEGGEILFVFSSLIGAVISASSSSVLDRTEWEALFTVLSVWQQRPKQYIPGVAHNFQGRHHGL
jgi:hypothetical protein